MALRSHFAFFLIVAACLAVSPAQAQAHTCNTTLCPAVSVTGAAAPQDELGTGTFTLTRDVMIPPTLDVTFELRTHSGEATYGAAPADADDPDTDYISSPAAPTATATGRTGTVTFAAGSATATVTIDPHFDLLADGGETVTLVVIGTATYNVINPSQGQMAIPDYGHNVVSAQIVDGDFNELNNPATLRINRTTGSLASALAVNVTLGGAATQGTDYSASPNLGTSPILVNIPAGQRHVDVVLTPIQDANPEPLESVTLTVLPAPAPPRAPETHYAIGVAGVSLNLVDDDRPAVSLTVPDATATEAGGTTARFVLTRNGPTTADMDVGAVLTGAARYAGNVCNNSDTTCDYTIENLTGSTARILAGQTTLTITLRAVDDTVPDPSEVAILTIQPSSSGAYNIVGSASGSIAVEDNDVQLLTATATDAAAAEASSTQTQNAGVVTITRTGPAATGALQVRYTLGGSATSNGTQRDYAVSPANANAVPIVGKLNFTASELTKTITLTPIDDNRTEAAETIVVTIVANGTAYQVGSPATATVTISDNDAAATDSDADGVLDAADNCPTTANGSGQTGADRNQANIDADALGDACDGDDDNDGLNDTLEGTHGTNPKVRDSDGDGRSDGDEVKAGTKPLDRFSPEYRPTDIRAAGTGTAIEVTWKAPAGSLVNRYLVFRESDPALVGTVVGVGTKTSYSFNDTTFPGGAHNYSVQAMLPTEASSLYNATLARTSSDAQVDMPVCQAITKDSDGDGLCDTRELYDTQTDPASEDSDGDGRTDGREVDDGTDPLDPNSVAANEVVLTDEAPFWVGLVLLVATLAALGVGLRMRRSAAPPPQPAQP